MKPKITCPNGHSERFFHITNNFRGDWVDNGGQQIETPDKSTGRGIYVCDVCGVLFYEDSGNIQHMDGLFSEAKGE